MRLRRVAAGFAQRAPLPQEVPALVQFDLHVGEALAAFRIEGLLPEEPVLLCDQAFDMGEHGCVLAMFFHGDASLGHGIGAVPNINPLRRSGKSQKILRASLEGLELLRTEMIEEKERPYGLLFRGGQKAANLEMANLAQPRLQYQDVGHY